MPTSRPLTGTRIAITRPAGTGGALARRVRALGGVPLLLPGSSLRAADDSKAAREALKTALASDKVIFTSPAAVRFAHRLVPLHARMRCLAPGAGTHRALLHAGCANPVAPIREDSEGLLALPALRDVRGMRIGIVGAPCGRGLLERALAGRGADVEHAYVYRRLPARLDRRHAEALRRDTRKPLYVLLSSAEALSRIPAGLPDDARRRLLAGSAVVSSGRLALIAHKAGFPRVLRAGTTHAADMLAAVIADRMRGDHGRTHP
jgi:uroporphyrinogen-III synthase